MGRELLIRRQYIETHDDSNDDVTDNSIADIIVYTDGEVTEKKKKKRKALSESNCLLLHIGVPINTPFEAIEALD